MTDIPDAPANQSGSGQIPPVAALLGAVCICAALAGCAGPPPLIEAGRAGRIGLGDSVESVEQAYPAERRRMVDLRLEGMPSPAVEVMPEGAGRPDALVAELIEQEGAMRVWRIQVRDPMFETAAGIGVGDTVADLRATYAAERLIGGEGNVGFRVEELGATFLLDTDGADGWTLSLDAEQVPDDVAIRQILLTGPL